MAKDEIILKLRVEDGDLKLSSANIDKQSKALDKNTKKKKQGTQGSNKFNKAEKALYQTNLSSAKGFSKMNQTMGGSSGLVAAYATLAANVFAATAAFGALSRAAQFENLKKGLTELGAQSGQTLSLVADRLRDVTGNAISMEEAMRSAAMGISGGFGGKELEGLAKIAKGASITLGRSLPDAFDRLTRGAIKLEPEILDELGIMVRVDEAAQAYAATIGKTAQSLTQMEKRQAFMNAILEQGESKFGAIADELDADPYSKLASTFHDLTQAMFGFVNETLKVGKVVGYLGENIVALAGVMILLGSSVLAKMIPALSDAGGRALSAAKSMHDLAQATVEAGAAQQKAKIMGLGVGMEARTGGEKAYLGQVKAIQKLVAEGKQDVITTKKLNELKTKNSQILSGLTRKGITRETAQSASHKASIRRAKTERRQINSLIAQEEVRIKLKQKALVLDTVAAEKAAVGTAIATYQAGAQTFAQASSTISGGYKLLAGNLDELSRKALKLKEGQALPWMTTAMNKLKAATVTATGQMQLLGTAFLKALPWIGALVAISAILYGIWQKVYNTKEHKAYVKSVDNLDKIFDELPKKAQAYERAVNNVKNLADAQVNSWKVVSGVITEITAGIEAMNKAREADIMNKDPRLDKTLGQMPGEERLIVGGAAEAGWERLDDGRLKLEKYTVALGSLSKQINEEGLDREGLEMLTKFANTEEVKRLGQLFETELPEVTKELAKGLNEGLQVISEETTGRQFLDMIKGIFVDSKSALGSLGPAAEALRTSFKEGEKEATNFLKTFAKKTSVDKLKDSLDSIQSTFKDFKQAVGDAGKTELEEFGKKFLDIGPAIGQLIGPEFERIQKSLREQSTILDKLKDKHGENSNEFDVQKKIVDDIVLSLGGQSSALIDVFDNVKAIQKSERQRKTINDQITKQIALQQKLYKSSVSLAGMDNKLKQKQLKMEVAVLKANKEILKMDTQRYKIGTYNSGQDMTIGYEELMDIVKDDAVTLANILADSNIDQEEFEQGQFGRFKMLMKVAELRNTESRSALEVQLQTAEALKEQLSLQEDIIKLQRTGNKLRQQHTNFIRKGTTALDAGATALLAIETAQQEYEFALNRAKIEKDIIAAKAGLQIKDMELLNAQIKLVNAQTDSNIQGIDPTTFTDQVNENTRLAQEAIDLNVINLRDAVVMAIDKAFKELGDALREGAISPMEYIRGIETIGKARTEVSLYRTGEEHEVPEGQMGPPAPVTVGDQTDPKEKRLMEMRQSIEAMKPLMDQMMQMAEQLGPEGEVMIAMNTGMFTMAEGFMTMASSTEEGVGRMALAANVAAGVLASIADIMAKSSQSKIANIDKEINAEKKRDGKSKQSLAKIKAMEAKKEQMKRKAFEQNKKMLMAQAVMNTAAAILSVFAAPDLPAWFSKVAMAVVMGAIGMAQIGIISSMKYDGGGASTGDVSTPSAINIGERGNKVDVSQQASAGELAYLRGARGIGTSSTAFTPTGGAAGLRKGYADGGEILVGERGPEQITPLSPMQVWPSDMGAKSQINANFTIHAIDAQGVEDVLMAQQGNIIGMIRSAANDHGEEFLEVVNTDMYGEPKSAGGVDY